MQHVEEDLKLQSQDPHQSQISKLKSFLFIQDVALNYRWWELRAVLQPARHSLKMLHVLALALSAVTHWRIFKDSQTTMKHVTDMNIDVRLNPINPFRAIAPVLIFTFTSIKAHTINGFTKQIGQSVKTFKL